MRINAQNELDLADADPAALLDSTMIPPSYGDHQFDMLYTEVDPRGFITPSSSQLPSRDHSRRGSSEDVENLANDEVSANTLRNRLAVIQNEPGSSSNLPIPRSASAQMRAEGGQSRQGSYAEGQGQTDQLGAASNLRSPSLTEPQHIEYNTAALSRVPSYNTAVQSSKRTPITADLPDYQTATSRPPSPSHDQGNSASTNGENEPSMPERHAHFAEASADENGERRSGLGLPLRARRQGSS
jgi:arrestin-related trafficking adapter 4/5/7